MLQDDYQIRQLQKVEDDLPHHKDSYVTGNTIFIDFPIQRFVNLWSIQ